MEYLRNMSPMWKDLVSGKKPFMLSIRRQLSWHCIPTTVMDHFMHPRNVGEIKDPSGVGEVGNAKCGDIMKMYLKIENDVIKDVKFETFGCGSAIATSSMATEMIKGKTVEEALSHYQQGMWWTLWAVCPPTSCTAPCWPRRPSSPP